ncbi:DUF4261 domain-containing protein [Symbiobacterium terraclitae]|uniref:DUF4261 domain-containing protein n=1 Tax=Symbiobacterium terraclitae TaxID=557451 RepID=UPI0035B50CF8
MDKQNSPLMAMMFLREPVEPDPKAVAARLRARSSYRYELRWDEAADGTRFYSLNGRQVVVALMRAPIPPGDWEEGYANHRYWPQAAQVLRQHRAHLIISLMWDQDDPIDRHLLFTDFVAAVSEAVDGLGILWGRHGALRSAELFRELAAKASEDGLPLPLWVDFEPVRHEGKFFMVTTGLDAFGVMEVEVGSARLKPDELFDRLLCVAHYLCTHGPVLKDGDTVGGSATERIPVRHTDSVLDRPGPVIRIDFDAGRRGLLSRLFGR